MPAIKITGAKGLHQVTANSTTPAGSLSGQKSVLVDVTDNTTLTSDDSGKVFVIGADAKTITLPSTVKGVVYTFVNGGTDGSYAINVSPAAADAIHGTVGNGTKVVLNGTDNKDCINTKATATTGDSLTIIGDGNLGWFVLGSTGIWASES